MENESLVGLIIQGLVAIGTISIAVLAVWGEWFRFKLASPKLSIEFHNPYGELTKFGDGTPARYYHLRVLNRRAWAPAKNVRILLVGIFRPSADETFLSEMQVGNLQLTWCFPQLGPMYRTIGPEKEECDLGYVTPNDFRLSTYVVPNNFKGTMAQPGRLRAEVMAVADNGRSENLTIEISWDGQWNEGEREMSRHLAIKEIA